MWARGVLNGSPIRESLKTRSWTKAKELADEMEEGKAAEPVTMDFALNAVLSEAVARKRCEGTMRKIRPLIASLRAYSTSHNLVYLPEFDLNHLRAFRASWKDNALSASKKLERVKSIWKFFVESGWLEKNTARPIEPPDCDDCPTLPFSDAEVQRIWNTPPASGGS